MRSRDQPAFLTEVMDTIATLKDSKGSPPDKILDHIVSSRRTPLKNASLQVKKALRTGLKTGLLKEISGKFKLGLDPKDYIVFKNFRQLEKNGGLPARESKRGRRGRRRRGRSRRRRGRRRRALGPSDDLIDFRNESSPEPTDRGRRGRRRRGRRRRRSRRGRKRAIDGAENESDRTSSHSKEVIHKSSEEKPKTAKSQQGRNDNERNDTSRGDVDKNHVDIDSLGSNHCFHGIHQENHSFGPPTHGHYGEYYDH